jgi:hypothetical protein
LSTSALGAIAAGSCAAYLAGGVAVAALAGRVGLRSGPLLAGALLVGLGASLYWTFAVDFLVTGGALLIGPLAAGPLTGVAGMEGVFTGAAVLLALTALLAPRAPVTATAAAVG